MPEGPSIVILKEQVAQFKGQQILDATGTAKIDIDRLTGKKVIDFKSWGKHFLICFNGFTVRIHLLLFGSYRVNEERDFKPRLSLKFKNGELNFYSCSVKIIEGEPDVEYDWRVDLMSDKWKAAEVKKRLQELGKKALVCDALLNQDIFAGSGNIIKNEVLFRLKLHPLTPVSALPKPLLTKLVNETRKYSFEFYTWKKAFVLRKHWQIYRAKNCPRCKIPVSLAVLGKTKRRTFYCANCQKRYKDAKAKI